MSERDIHLEPCPFCGEEVELYSDYDDVTSAWIYWIACGECGCRQPKSIHKQAVINGWNTRKDVKKKNKED